MECALIWPFFAQICALSTLCLPFSLASFACFLGEKRRPQVTSKSALILRRTAREASKRGTTLRFLANRAAIGTTTFREQNATHSCKARCLILFRQLRHCVPFSTPLFGSEKLPISSIHFTWFYATLRLFTPLLRKFPPPLSCDFNKFIILNAVVVFFA